MDGMIQDIAGLPAIRLLCGCGNLYKTIGSSTSLASWEPELQFWLQHPLMGFPTHELSAISFKWRFPKMGVPPKSSILLGFSLINIHLGGTPILGNPKIIIHFWLFQSFQIHKPSRYCGSPFWLLGIKSTVPEATPAGPVHVLPLVAAWRLATGHWSFFGRKHPTGVW